MLGSNTRNRPLAVDNPLIAFSEAGLKVAWQHSRRPDAANSRVCLDLPNICFFFLAPKLFSKGAKKARNGNGNLLIWSTVRMRWAAGMYIAVWAVHRTCCMSVRISSLCWVIVGARRGTWTLLTRRLDCLRQLLLYLEFWIEQFSCFFNPFSPISCHILTREYWEHQRPELSMASLMPSIANGILKYFEIRADLPTVVACERNILEVFKLFRDGMRVIKSWLKRVSGSCAQVHVRVSKSISSGRWRQKVKWRSSRRLSEILDSDWSASQNPTKDRALRNSFNFTLLFSKVRWESLHHHRLNGKYR